MLEVWKSISNTNSEYEISNQGNIRRHISGKIVPVKPQKDRCGYYRVKIFEKTYAVHRLVAMEFIPNPYNYPIVHHIDENKTNNVSTNLIWCTHQQNRIFGVPASSGKNSKKRYKVLQFDMDGNLLSEWNTFTEAAHSLGINDPSVISKCAHHLEHRNSAYGYRWEMVFEDNNDGKFLVDLVYRAFKVSPSDTISALNKIIVSSEKA